MYLSAPDVAEVSKDGYLRITKAQHRRIDEARDAFHHAVLDVLREAGINSNRVNDITATGEALALEGAVSLDS